MFLSRSLPRRIHAFVFTVLLTLPAAVFADNAADAERELFRMLYDNALLADAAYQGKSAVADHLAGRGYTLTAHGRLPGYGVSYFLATNDDLKQQILCVRGTSNIENALVDVAFKLLPDERAGVKLHQGFGKSADYLYEQVLPMLDREYRIHTTGHSLGGAAALVLAMYLDADGYDIGKVITFGQPKVTNIAGSRKYSHLDVMRVVTPKDMVPLVPPLDPLELMNMDIYWHLGTEIILYEDNRYSSLEGMDSMMRATDFMNEMMTEKNLQDHYMSSYINAIVPKMLSARLVPYENDFSITDLFGGAGR